MKIKYLAMVATVSLLGVGGLVTGCAETASDTPSVESPAADPCGAAADPCAAKKEDPCGAAADPCAAKKEDPCGAAADPCAAKTP